MRYSVGFGPVRVYGGRQKERRPKRPLTPKAALYTFITWLLLCIGGIVWLGVATHSAPVVIGAIFALPFVTIKVLMELAKDSPEPSTSNEKVG